MTAESVIIGFTRMHPNQYLPTTEALHLIIIALWGVTDIQSLQPVLCMSTGLEPPHLRCRNINDPWRAQAKFTLTSNGFSHLAFAKIIKLDKSGIIHFGRRRRATVESL